LPYIFTYTNTFIAITGKYIKANVALKYVHENKMCEEYTVFGSQT